ncbi:MAG: hypothetical protein RL216_2651 [Pseudomonadota bacterium]|jgi:hypothetical protein
MAFDAGCKAKGWMIRSVPGLAVAAMLAAVVLLPGPVVAQDQAAEAVPAEVAAQVDALLAAMRIDDTIEVLREEGIDYGRTLEADMFAGTGGAGWEATVGLIYDGQRMREAFGQALAQELAAEPEAIGEIVAFFASDLGQRAVALEIEARRAFLDDATEEAAKVAVEELRAEEGPRLALLDAFVAVNDLVESNVQGALNANLSFYQGMDEGGAFGGEMTEDQMLSDVWAQEPEVRQSTTDWVYSYLHLAYGPLSDAELQAYIDFSRTEAGQTANAALFAAYDQVFTPISRALGVAVARQLQGQDI